MARRGAKGRTRSCVELSGPLLPVKTEGAAAAAQEEEEEGGGSSDDGDDPAADFEFPDVAGKGLDRPTRRQEVIIQDEKSQKQYLVVGRLPFIDPWWKVTVKVKQVGSKYHIQGYPSYFLQTDAGENQGNILLLFFKACNVPEEFRIKFSQWLETNPSGASLNFVHLEETLNLFQKSELEGGQTSADTSNFNIFHYIKNSFAGKAVLVALAFPEIVEFLPKLLPRNISGCIEWLNWDRINSEEDECDKLTKLNQILKEEPWKLGFSTMMYRALHTTFVEVSWTTFCECGLLEKIPNLQKNALLIYAKLQEKCRKMGYTYEEQDKLTLLVSEDMPIECAWQSLKFLKDEEIVVTEGKLVFLYKLYRAEKEIAATVRDLIQRPSLQLHADPKKALNCGAHVTSVKDQVESKIQDEEPCEMGHEEPSNISDVEGDCDNSCVCAEHLPKEEMKTEVDPDQERAVGLLCACPVTVISGKAGSGKTTVVTSLFRFLKKMEEEEIRKACEDFEADLDTPDEWSTCSQNFNWNACQNESLNILFAAPTGRAATLLHEKTQQPAHTLHQVIWSYYSWQSNQSDTEPWKFSKINILVVDEGSLVSVEVLSRVLWLLFHKARLAKLIILGDVRQLPSIGPGNMLADIFEFLKSRGCALDLRTNHRAESQLIVENATRISQQRYPVFDAVVRISEEEVGPMPSPEKKFILVALPAEDGSQCLQSAINALLERGPGLEDAKLSQFISFRRQDCDIVNELCCRHYSKHSMRNAKNQPHFECGDKVCSTRNAYIKDLISNNILCTRNDDSSSNSSPCKCNVCVRRRARASARDPHFQKEEKKVNHDDDSRLCNGEIFFIKKDSKVDHRRILTISLPGGKEYTMFYRALLKTSKIKHAWARTIHTFQGSEENTIVYVVGNSGLQNWQHVYTAVTRGRSRVYVVANEEKLSAAIAQKSSFRKTYLRKRLKDAVTGKMDDSEQMSSPQRSGYFAFCSGNSSMNKEELLVSGVELDGTAEETSLYAGERKRQRQLPDECSSPSKMALIKEDESPLGINRLQKMTLKSPVSKQLFRS